MSKRLVPFAAALAAAVLSVAADARDKVRIIDSQVTVFDAFALYQAQAEGYFDAADLDISIIVGRGGADSLQAVVTGSADLIYGTGALAVVSAYAKGAPVVIVGNAKRGASDAYWYVRVDSPIKKFKDLDGRQFTFSAPGSFTNLTVQTLSRELGIAPKFVATGSMTATRTQVMSGQVDTGWAGFPANLDLFRSGEARMIGTGDESPLLSGMSTRVLAANADWLAKNRDVAVRALAAIWKGQQYNFSGPKAIERYAQHWKIALDDAKRAGEFFKLEDVTFSPIGKLEDILRLARDYGFIKEPLTEDQKRGLVQIVYDPKRG
jgi:NitT/TauT family transport system substrate-binding protein